MELIFDGKKYDCIDIVNLGRYEISKYNVLPASTSLADLKNYLFYVKDKISFDRILFDFEEGNKLEEIVSKIKSGEIVEERLLMLLEYYFTCDE